MNKHYLTCSQRMLNVQSPIIPTIAEQIRQTPGTISLGQGVVNYEPPAAAFSAVEKTMNTAENHLYGPVEGIQPLLEIVQKKLSSDNNIEVDNDQQVVITAGSNMGFLNAVLAITDPGDEVILLAPYYFNHRMAIEIANCNVIVVDTDEEYQPDIEKITLAMTEKTRAIVTVSPNNPTGVVYEEAILRAINHLCHQNGIYHISDEAYEYFVYEGEQHFSPGSISGANRHTISLFSLSKSYGLAGWRIGYMVIPEQLFTAVQKVQDTNLICAPQVSQQAALAALTVGSSYCKKKIADLDENRKSCLNILKSIEFKSHITYPTGAFYIFIKLESEMTSMELVTRLIREYKVAAIPGNTFGDCNKCSLRIAYAALEKEDLEIAMERMVIGLGHIIS